MFRVGYKFALNALFLIGLLMAPGIVAKEDFLYSDRFPQELKSQLSGDLELMKTLEFENIPQDSDYFLFFESQKIDAALNFVKKRVKYFDFEESSMHNSVADNLGFELWFKNFFRIERLLPRDLQIPFTHDHTVEIEDTPRVGYVMLYSDTFLRRSPLFRMQLLVHEARHSDCHGVHSEDIDHLALMKTYQNPAVMFMNYARADTLSRE